MWRPLAGLVLGAVLGGGAPAEAAAPGGGLTVLTATGAPRAVQTASTAGGAPSPDPGLVAPPVLTSSAGALRAGPVIAAEAAGLGAALAIRAELTALLLDYGLPRHPSAVGISHTGAVLEAVLAWRLDPRFALEAGVRARLPFAHEILEELGAFPVLALVARPFGPETTLRLGSLCAEHGYHPALTDEARQRYGLLTEKSYNRSLVPEARRDLGGDPFLPGEHGAQLLFREAGLAVEAFLDWQLLESLEHREKFVFGALVRHAGVRHVLEAQLRWVHYGGEEFTQRDPIRAAGLDPVRQPISLLLGARLGPLEVGPLALSLPAAVIAGRLIQGPGEAPAWRRGVEIGLEARWFELWTTSYLLWLPLGARQGLVSEDGDPVYAGPRSQRVRLGMESTHGRLRLGGRLDLVFPRGSPAVQYEVVTVLGFTLDEVLWARVTGERPGATP